MICGKDAGNASGTLRGKVDRLDTLFGVAGRGDRVGSRAAAALCAAAVSGGGST